MDTSITAAWCIPDEATPTTDLLLNRLREESAVVPVIWPLEITNVLLTAERRGRVMPAEIAPVFAFLADLPITIDTDGLSHAFQSVPALGRAHQLTSYDAAYLELAMRSGLPLATLDDDLARAANAVGVPLLI